MVNTALLFIALRHGDRLLQEVQLHDEKFRGRAQRWLVPAPMAGERAVAGSRADDGPTRRFFIEDIQYQHKATLLRGPAPMLLGSARNPLEARINKYQNHVNCGDPR